MGRRLSLFALACAGVIALGVAANTLVFSILYSAVLKPLPYAQPGQLVAVHNRFADRVVGASAADYFELPQHEEIFARAGGWFFVDYSRTGIDRPVKVNAIAVTPSLIETLGVAPALGRAFADDQERGLLISDLYWREGTALGQVMYLNGDAYTVVGVMPPSFRFPNDATQMWVPLALHPPAAGARENYGVRMLARLATGVSPESAARYVESMSRRVASDAAAGMPHGRPGWQWFVTPLSSDNDGSVRRALWVLAGCVACLLFIACANVAGLLLARAQERQFEFDVRRALGASRLRIVRQVLAEILWLSAAGGAAGIALAYAGILALGRVPGVGDVHIEPMAIWFGAALAIATGLMCGIIPAWTASQGREAAGLKERTGSVRKQRAQASLIVAQVAMATVLLLCGGLLTRSLARLLDVAPGFDPHSVLTLEISTPPARHPTGESRVAFFENVLEGIRRLPGVESASGCTLLPFGYGENYSAFAMVGQPMPSEDPLADMNVVQPDYFTTMRIPILAGRALTAADRLGSQQVAVVDETLARQHHATIGQRIRARWGEFTVVGIAGGVHNSSLDADVRPTAYFSALQIPPGDQTIVIRAASFAGLAGGVARAVTALDPDQPIYEIATMDEVMNRSLRTRRLLMRLTGGFAGGGLLLAAVGLYGLLAYAISMRRREIGIRMALGADAWNIARWVSRRATAIVAVGIALGVLASFGARRWLASQLYGIEFHDRLTWIAVIAAVAIASAAACAVPAWRAARVDPVKALRSE